MPRRTALVPLALLALAACSRAGTPALPAPAGGGTTAAVTEADLRRHLEVIAADSMEGREAGSRGHVMATDYLASELARLGVEPAGENGTFFQVVPLVSRRLRPDAVLRGSGRALTPGDDYVFVAELGPMPIARTAEWSGVEVVYAGAAGDTASTIPADVARGRVVLVGAPRGPDGQRTFGLDGGSLGRYREARAIAFVTLDVMPAEIREYLVTPEITLAEDAGADAEGPGGPALLFVSPAGASALLGRDVATALPGVVGGPAEARLGRVSAPVPHPSRNVVGIVRGSDPRLRQTYVAIGAHSDHVGTAPAPVLHDSLRAHNSVVRPMGAEDMDRPATAEEATRIRAVRDSLAAVRPDRPDRVFNGADDDGSGTAALLELAERFARADRRPARSLLFVWHTAEEKGLFGAQWYTEHPTVPRDSIVAALNIDMIGRGTARDLADGGPGYVQLIGSRRLSTELGDLVEQVNRERALGFTFDYQFDAAGHPQQYYCRSDHYMYARFGIPVVFFTTGGHVDYHQRTDEVEYIDFGKLRAVTGLIGDIAAAVADRPQRPRVDGTVIGPDQPCQQ